MKSKKYLDLELFQAAGEGDLEEVKSLLAQGANINAYDDMSQYDTPLAIAVGEEHTEVVQFLLDQGAFIHYNAVEIASSSGRVDFIRLFLSKGISAECAECAFAAAVEAGHPAVIRLFLDYGTDVKFCFRNVKHLLVSLSDKQLLNIKHGYEVEQVMED